MSSPASVDLCVRVCVYQSRACPHDNASFVQDMITQSGPDVQNTLVNRPWTSMSDLNLKSKFTSFWACPHYNSSAVQAAVSKFEIKMHLDTIKIHINFCLDWLWYSLSFSIWKLFFLQSYLRSFCIIFSKTCRSKISGRPSLGTDQFSFGFWLNISFVVNYRGTFRSIIDVVMDLLTSVDRYFLRITAVPMRKGIYDPD